MPPSAQFSVCKHDQNMLQDVLPVFPYPWDDIFNNPFLAPAPLFAAAAALHTVLVSCHRLFSFDYRIGEIVFVLRDLLPGEGAGSVHSLLSSTGQMKLLIIIIVNGFIHPVYSRQ